jgi:putative SOS response-associated peptidase YedK
MCNDYELNIDLPGFLLQLKQAEGLPRLCWMSRVPRHPCPTSHVRIADWGLVLRLGKDCLRAGWLPWAWEERDERVFNVRSERRVFATSERCLVLATGFYEYTKPAEPQGKLPDQHIVRLKDHEWFWMPAIVKQGAFALVTTYAGPDVRPLNRRQACVLAPSEGMAWLELSQRPANLLKPSREGSLEVTTLRKDCLLRRDARSAA